MVRVARSISYIAAFVLFEVCLKQTFRLFFASYTAVFDAAFSRDVTRGGRIQKSIFVIIYWAINNVTLVVLSRDPPQHIFFIVVTGYFNVKMKYFFRQSLFSHSRCSYVVYLQRG